MEIIDHRDLVIEKEKLFIKKKRLKKIKNKPQSTCETNYTPSISGYIVSILLGLLFYSIILTLFLTQNGWRENYTLPNIFPSPIIIIIVTSITYLFLMIGLLLVIKQGANKKVYGLYLANSISVIILITVIAVFRLFIIGLFISLLCVFLAFTLQHELTKLNKFAYYSFVPYSILIIIACVLIYLLTMLN